MEIRSIPSRAPRESISPAVRSIIWPIYLFLNNPVTINLGIDLYAEADLEQKPAKNSGEITLRSEDQDQELTLPWSALENTAGGTSDKIPPQLILHFKLLQFFAHQKAGSPAMDLTLRHTRKKPCRCRLGRFFHFEHRDDWRALDLGNGLRR